MLLFTLVESSLNKISNVGDYLYMSIFFRNIALFTIFFKHIYVFSFSCKELINLELIVSGLQVVFSEVQNEAPEKVCNCHSAAKHLHKFAWPHLQTLICEVPKYSSTEQLVGS